MTTTKGGARCKYCWYPADGILEHNEQCPVLTGTPEAMAEWKRGHEHGFNYDHEEYGRIELWNQHYSLTYRMGYRVGEAEIDKLVQIAYERCYGLELDPEDD